LIQLAAPGRIAEAAKEDLRMRLRCKDGDLAVITWDHQGCRQNIGRLVQVRGPVRNDGFGPAWRIRPITENLYHFLERDGSLGQESVTWQSRIDHPDAWMIPIKPKRKSTTRSSVAETREAVPLVESGVGA